MRILSLVALWSLSAGVTLAEPVNLKVQRLDDSFIDVWIDPPAEGAKAGIVLMFQGSECLSVAPGGDRIPLTLPAGVVRMDIEKYGITPEAQRAEDGTCPADYLANNTIDGRVIDAMTVLAHLRSHAEWWDGRLFVGGLSEGATLAAIVGALASETEGVMLVNGSVGRPFREGWAESVVNAVREEGGDAATIEQALAEVEATWVRARATPTTATYEGPSNTLRWWRSMIDLRPVNLLLNLDAPILLVQSELDEMTPVASAREVVRRFEARGRTNLTYREFAGLDHGFRDTQGRPQYMPLLQVLNETLAAQVAASASP